MLYNVQSEYQVTGIEYRLVTPGDPEHTRFHERSWIMKRVLLTAAVALLIPSILAAAPATLGVYFNGSLTGTPPGVYMPFIGALYIVQNELYVTGVEYSLVTPNDPAHTWLIIQGYTYPPNHSLTLGDAFNGQSLTYWPPLTGYPEGYDLLVTYRFVALMECEEMWDYPIVVSAHSDSGYLRGTYAPDHELFDIIGLTSILCPFETGTEESSWGAIKSMMD